MRDSRPVTVFWFRRDLRVEDNHGFYRALKDSPPVLPLFIFDPVILDKLTDKQDKRVAFIHQLVAQLSAEFRKWGSSLYVVYGEPVAVFERLLTEANVGSVVTNHDFEPDAIERDNKVRTFLAERRVPFHTFKDQVMFDPAEIVKPDGTPYVVFSPYSREWKRRFAELRRPAYPSETHLHHLWSDPSHTVPSLREMGFEPADHGVSPILLSRQLISNYENTRNLPYLDGTSQASPHLRFGTVSVRHLVALAAELSEVWLNELIWREFFMMILYHFPSVVTRSFRRQYDAIPWRNNEREFEAWCTGMTGYPLVDAGMRQLNGTGWMHNRVRMVVASFLTKHLLIDWRWGEAYFAEKLLDFELASNNGNWQWAAGCGCDAAPYFRVFNPGEQAKKFDPENIYIKKWIPGYAAGYLEPIVEHRFARERALATYKKALRAVAGENLPRR